MSMPEYMQDDFIFWPRVLLPNGDAANGTTSRTQEWMAAYEPKRGIGENRAAAQD